VTTDATAEGSARVLVVEDEAGTASLYARWVQDDHEVLCAHSGEEALELVDETVDVVLLDRRMPGLSGDTVLAEIRERALDCRVVMVTAVEPDFDIVNMGFDDYVVKPVTGDELRETVRTILVREDYDRQLRRYFATASKKAVLEAEKSPSQLERSEEYERITRRLEELRAGLDESLDEMDDTATAFREAATQSVPDGGPST